MQEVVIEAPSAPTNVPGTGFPYPGGIVSRLLRLPIWMYRMGLGRVVNALHIMVLTTQGRKSGLPRHTAIEYRAHGRKLYVISAWAARPDWYQNLVANPVVSLRLGERKLSADAHVVTDSDEALRVLNVFRKTAPAVYDALMTRLSSEESVSRKNLPDVSDQFTIVRFEPVDGRSLTLPTVNADWRWIWPLALFVIFVLFVVWVAGRRTKA